MADKKSVAQTLKHSNFPDEGEFFKNSLKDTPSSYLVIFVHFLNGHKKVLRRHIDLVNELGYDAYVFNLNDSLKDYSYFPLSRRNKKFGLKHVLAEQIENHINLFPEYKNKIIYAFSNIAACAMEAVSHRMTDQKAKDIKAMICDSGPGADFMTSAFNLFRYELKVNSFTSRLLQAPLFALAWSPKLNCDVHQDLKTFPKNFPILSIRGWRDQLISPDSIDKIFEPHQNLKWKKLNLPEAGHINGLRDFPSEYRPGVESFLDEIAK